jgi:hypothetical protein
VSQVELAKANADGDGWRSACLAEMVKLGKRDAHGVLIWRNSRARRNLPCMTVPTGELYLHWLSHFSAGSGFQSKRPDLRSRRDVRQI